MTILAGDGNFSRWPGTPEAGFTRRKDRGPADGCRPRHAEIGIPHRDHGHFRQSGGRAPPSFYVYFADTRDLLLALAADASDAMKALGRHFEPPLVQTADKRAWAEGFVQDFVTTWDAHCGVLAIRDLEADSGDKVFDELRVDSSLPVLSGLTDQMLANRPAGTRRVDVFSEAVIYYAVLERIATIERTTQPNRLQPKHYKKVLSRMIADAIRGQV